MESNTVILSLERYHELQKFEKIVLERKCYIQFIDWRSGQRNIYLSEDSKQFDDLFNENESNKIKLRAYENEYEKNKNTIKTKKWWQIWK